MTLAELKKEYIKNLKLSKIELGNLDPRNRYRQEGVVNGAKQKIDKLYPQLMSMVLNDSTTVYISSDMDLATVLKEITADTGNSNVSVLDFLGLEKHLVAEVYPQKHVKGYAFNSATVSRLNNAIFDLRNVIGASFIPPVVASNVDYKVLSGPEAALDHMHEVIYKAYKNDLKSLYLAKQMNTFTEKSMVNNDKMVFFITNTTGNTKGLDQITGKTVFVTNEDAVPTTAAGLQSLVTGKLRKTKKDLTKPTTK
jgi:hypothetical protein